MSAVQRIAAWALAVWATACLAKLAGVADRQMRQREASTPEQEGADTTGAWVSFMYDVGPVGMRVFGSEMDALRAAQCRGGYDRVKFLPFGEELK